MLRGCPRIATTWLIDCPSETVDGGAGGTSGGDGGGVIGSNTTLDGTGPKVAADTSDRGKLSGRLFTVKLICLRSMPTQLPFTFVPSRRVRVSVCTEPSGAGT